MHSLRVLVDRKDASTCINKAESSAYIELNYMMWILTWGIRFFCLSVMNSS